MRNSKFKLKFKVFRSSFLRRLRSKSSKKSEVRRQRSVSPRNSRPEKIERRHESPDADELAELERRVNEAKKVLEVMASETAKGRRRGGTSSRSSSSSDNKKSKRSRRRRSSSD